MGKIFMKLFEVYRTSFSQRSCLIFGFLTLFVSYFSVLLPAQQFGGNGAVWNYDYSNFATRGTISIQQTGDTVLHDRECMRFKAVMVGVNMFPPTPVPVTDTSYYHIAASQELVEIWNVETELWDTAYIFNGYPGLTWNLNRDNFWPDIHVEILDTGTIEFQGIAMDMYTVQYYTEDLTRTDTVYDRIGNTNYFMLPWDPFLGDLDAHSGGDFLCFQDQDISFPNPEGTCDLIANVDGPIIDESTFVCFPNPVSDILNILPGSNAVVMQTYRLMNSNGMTVRSGKGVTNQLDLSSIPAGLYFLNIRTAESQYIQKVVKE